MSKKKWDCDKNDSKRKQLHEINENTHVAWSILHRQSKFHPEWKHRSRATTHGVKPVWFRPTRFHAREKKCLEIIKHDSQLFSNYQRPIFHYNSFYNVHHNLGSGLWLFISNAVAEALPKAKNTCQWNIVAQQRTSFPYTVFNNMHICVGRYPNKKQNWTTTH